MAWLGGKIARLNPDCQSRLHLEEKKSQKTSPCSPQTTASKQGTRSSSFLFSYIRLRLEFPQSHVMISTYELSFRSHDNPVSLERQFTKTQKTNKHADKGNMQKKKVQLNYMQQNHFMLKKFTFKKVDQVEIHRADSVSQNSL